MPPRWRVNTNLYHSAIQDVTPCHAWHIAANRPAIPITTATPEDCVRTASIPQVSINYIGLPLLYHENLAQYFRPNYGPQKVSLYPLPIFSATCTEQLLRPNCSLLNERHCAVSADVACSSVLNPPLTVHGCSPYTVGLGYNVMKRILCRYKRVFLYGA